MPNPHIRLRPLTLADAEVLASWADDAEFCAHAGWTQGGDASATLTWWRERITHPDSKLIRLLALHCDEAVGYVDLYGDESSTKELGFVIGPCSNWSRGLGTAAARAGLDYGFGLLGLDRIWAEAVEANEHSVRILRRLGMHSTGGGDPETFLGYPSRYVQFELTRSDWGFAQN